MNGPTRTKRHSRNRFTANEQGIDGGARFDFLNSTASSSRLTRPRHFPTVLEVIQTIPAISGTDSNDDTSPDLDEGMGHLGPASYAAILSDVGYQNSNPRYKSGTSPARDKSVASPAQLESVCKVIETFRSRLAAYEVAITEYFKSSQLSVFPNIFLSRAMTAVAKSFREDWANRTSEDLAIMIIRNTAKPFDIPMNTEGTYFHELFTGQNTRLEIIGNLAVTAAYAQYYGITSPLSEKFEVNMQRTEEIEEIMYTCDVCVNTCRSISSPNILFLALLRNDINLADMLTDDCSMYQPCSRNAVAHMNAGPLVYRKLGEIVTDFYAYGLHREIGDADCPGFVLEIRRRFWATAFYFDKVMAAFLGRPPRMCRRHSDLRMASDLSDEELCGSRINYERALTGLDANGWRMTPTITLASWLRLRYILAIIREDIVDLSLGPPTERTKEVLK